MSTNTETIEIFDIGDTDSEEEDNKEEKEKKIKTDLFSAFIFGLISKSNLHLTGKIPLLVIHPEITTPPPKGKILFS